MSLWKLTMSSWSFLGAIQTPIMKPWRSVRANYILQDLGHCPVLGRGQEVRVAMSSALHSDWTGCLCQRRFLQFNAPCRNKTHSVGLYVYSSNVKAKLIMRADYRLYIVRRRLFIQHALCTPNSQKKNCIFHILEASPHYLNYWHNDYIAVVTLPISYILITQYPVHTRIHLCQSYRFLCSDRWLQCFINKFFFFGSRRMNVINVYIHTSIIFVWIVYGFL